MNILLLPTISGGLSHLIPLFVLHQRYFKRMESVNSAFLLSEKLHEQPRRMGIGVLPIDFDIDRVVKFTLNVEK